MKFLEKKEKSFKKLTSRHPGCTLINDIPIEKIVSIDILPGGRLIHLKGGRKMLCFSAKFPPVEKAYNELLSKRDAEVKAKVAENLRRVEQSRISRKEKLLRKKAWLKFVKDLPGESKERLLTICKRFPLANNQYRRSLRNKSRMKRHRRERVRFGLFKSIIKSDFFLVKKQLSDNYKIKPVIKLTNNGYYFLDLFKQTKEIRQLYLIMKKLFLNSLKQSIKKNNRGGLILEKNKRKLFLLLEDKNHCEMASNYFKLHKSKIVPKISEELRYLLNNKKVTRYLISTGNLSYSSIEEKIRKSKIYMVNSINMNSSVTNSHYRVFNKLDSNKKLYLILSIIQSMSKYK